MEEPFLLKADLLRDVQAQQGNFQQIPGANYAGQGGGYQGGGGGRGAGGY